jgi:succinate dehydrogenase / fumarate reductase, membrane anchor subunit
MAQNFGSKRVVVGAHYGLRDWMAQRITAVLMAVFTVVLLVQVLLPGPMGYNRWAGIFSNQAMKLLTLVVVIALAYHVWVGIRDVLMDYVRPLVARLVLQVSTIVWLLACTAWSVQVLWRL